MQNLKVFVLSQPFIGSLLLSWALLVIYPPFPRYNQTSLTQLNDNPNRAPRMWSWPQLLSAKVN